jgi:hypothetical protein
VSPLARDMKTVEIPDTAVANVLAMPWLLEVPSTPLAAMPTTPNPEDAETLVANLVANR